MTQSENKLNATLREITGKKVKNLRAEGNIPAVVYGFGIESINITVDTKDFIKLYKEAGEATVIDLMIEGHKSPKKVLIKEIDVDYVQRKLRHVSFYAIDMKQEIDTEVPLVIVSESPAEKTGAVVIQALSEVEVRCLPSDLPSQIEVDKSVLIEIGDTITLKDLVLPKGVKLMLEEDELEQIIISATAQITEEQEEALAAKGEAPVADVETTEQVEVPEGEEGEGEGEESAEEPTVEEKKEKGTKG